MRRQTSWQRPEHVARGQQSNVVRSTRKATAVKLAASWVAAVGAEVAGIDTQHKRWAQRSSSSSSDQLVVVRHELKEHISHRLLYSGGLPWCSACRRAGCEARSHCEGALAAKFIAAQALHREAGLRQHHLRGLRCTPDNPALPVVVCIACGSLGTRLSRNLMAHCRGAPPPGGDGSKVLDALSRGKLLRNAGISVCFAEA